jgi:prolyl oligopeptidase
VNSFTISKKSAPISAVIESIDGITVIDDFRWLEPEDAATQEWERVQDENARRRLSSAPWLGRVKGELPRHLAAMRLSAPVAAGNLYFQRAYSGELICSELAVGDGKYFLPGTKETTDRESPTFDWFQPCPNGRYVAYGAPEGGGLQGGAQLLRLRILDARTGLDLGIRIPHVAAGLAWLPDSTGFYFMRGLKSASVCPDRRVSFYSMVDGEFHDEPLRGLGFASQLQISKDGRYLSVVTGTREPRADWILQRDDGSWRPFLMEVPATCFGFFANDDYFALTNWKSPHGRIVKIPLGTHSVTSSWMEIVPQTERTKRNLVEVGEYLLVGELDSCNVCLSLYDRSGGLVSDALLPDSGSVTTDAGTGWFQHLTEPMVSADPNGLFFVHSDYARAPNLFRFDFKTRQLEQLTREGWFENWEVEDKSFTASDGESVPVELVYRNDCRFPAPTLIYTYGAYNFATVRSWIGVLGPFVEAGGVAVFAHIRGGGEFGTEWWRAGHHEHKQQSFNDIYSVAEGLISAQIGAAERIGVWGLSNGGLNVCTAIVQRPDLFRVGIALAPHCDLLRYSRDPFCGGAPIEGHHEGLHVNGGTWRDPIWGKQGTDTANVRAHFEQSMYPDPLQYSPYHLVKEGTRYPSLMLVCGREDVWCPPWHSRKFAASMQAATTSSNPILFRVWEGAGHEHPMRELEQIAEWLSFAMQELGMSVEERNSE